MIQIPTRRELCLWEVKKKRITQEPDASTLEPSTPELPSQQEFHQYLRTLAQSAVRTVIEAVMREELDAFCLRVIIGFFALMFKPKPQIIVTYQRGAVQQFPSTKGKSVSLVSVCVSLQLATNALLT